MKEIWRTSFFILLLGLILSGCASDTPGAKEERTVTLRIMNSFTEVTAGSQKVVTESEEIAMWHKAIKDSVPRLGIVNMAEPRYQVDLGDSVHYLWISEDSGTVMNTSDTHTIRTLTPKYVKAVYEAILRHYPEQSDS